MRALTLIIPTLTAGPALDKCLSSVAKQTFNDFDITIVSNGRKLSEHDLMLDAGLERKTRLIVSGENRGYGAACNLGARATDAPFLLFLNDDTFLQPDCLAELYKSLNAEKDTLLQPMIHHEYARQTRTGNPCDVFGAAGLGFYGNCGTGEFYASGAALAMSKTVYDSLGGFDERLFLYCDDVDLSWRARLLGFKISAARNALCSHSGGGSSGTMPHTVKFYFTQRNRIRVLIKNYSLRRIISRVPVASCLILAGAFFLAIKTRRAGYLTYASKALAWNMIGLRDTLRQRYLIQQARVESEPEIEKAMCKESMDLCVLKRYLASGQ